MNEKNKSRLAVRILCCILAGLMVLGGATYILYAFVGLL